MSKKTNNFYYILIALILLIAIILLFISFGKIDLINNTTKDDKEGDVNDDLSQRKIKLSLRHKKLKTLIDRKKELSIKLKNKFSRIYFWVRFSLIVLWLTCNFLIWKFGFAKNLSEILSFNEAALLLLIALNFLLFKNLNGIKEIIEYVKNFIENRVYKKYIKIEIQIENHSDEAVYLEAEMHKIEDEIKMISSMEKLLEKV